MNRCLVLILIILCSSCANRGYKSLVYDVPELFDGLEKESYVFKETPKNYLYLSKKLPSKHIAVNEFHEDQYVFYKNKKEYEYYVPISRDPSSLLYDSNFANWPKIKTNLYYDKKAILID